MSQLRETIEAYVDAVSATLSQLSTDTIERLVQVLEEARAGRKQVFLLGNGGSAATASHLVCDLAKGAVVPGKPRLRAIALTDNVPLFSAWANDNSYEDVFTQQLADRIDPGDVVIGISGSGRSPNVLGALKLAKSAGAVTIGLTGFDGGEIKDLVDLCLLVPNNCMEQVEDVHVLVGHILATCLRRESPRE